ncbi:MAG: heparan-alpha-glucosaminide N-acetyltransferase domain-containing protein [Myxococcota bacterium]
MMRSPATHSGRRIDGLDIARGFAITLMFLSHTVKGLLWFKHMPDYGIVPIHAITKFSSALFILVFGVTLAVVYLPKVGTATWPQVRWKLWERAVVIMFWYKALIIVQMFERSKPAAVMDTLLWKRFPDFVRSCSSTPGLYCCYRSSFPLWNFLPFIGRVIFTLSMGIASYWLRENFDFWGIWQLKAILVEHPKAFCFGVLSRGSMALTDYCWAKFFFAAKRSSNRAQARRRMRRYRSRHAGIFRPA